MAHQPAHWNTTLDLIKVHGTWNISVISGPSDWHFHVLLQQKQHNRSSKVMKRKLSVLKRERVNPTSAWCNAWPSVWALEKATQPSSVWMAKTVRVLAAFLPEGLMLVAYSSSDKRSGFIPVVPARKIYTAVATCGTESTDKSLHLLMPIQAEPSSDESSASLLIWKPLNATIHPQPCAPHSIVLTLLLFLLITKHYSQEWQNLLLTIIQFLSSPVLTKRKYRKKKLFEKKKRISPITNDLILRKDFYAKTLLCWICQFG